MPAELLAPTFAPTIIGVPKTIELGAVTVMVAAAAVRGERENMTVIKIAVANKLETILIIDRIFCLTSAKRLIKQVIRA